MRRYLARSVLMGLAGVVLLTSLARSHRTSAPLLYLDPGHGGTDHGACTYITDYCEDSINMEVADSVAAWWTNMSTYWGFASDEIVLSRLYGYTVSLTARAYQADSLMAASFVSVHHNSPNTAGQYSLTLYSSLDTVKADSTFWWDGVYRDTTCLLATKLAYTIDQAFQYGLQDTCPWQTGCQYTVLCRTYMASSITEASFITVPAEANLFHLNGLHAAEEARAILFGWHRTGLRCR